MTRLRGEILCSTNVVEQCLKLMTMTEFDKLELWCPFCIDEVVVCDYSDAWDKVSSVFSCPGCGENVYMGVDEDGDCNYWFFLDKP